MTSIRVEEIASQHGTENFVTNMSNKQNDIYFEDLKEHQDEVINTLEKERNEVDIQIQKLMDKRDVITNTIVKFQTQILLSQTKWKLDEQN